MAFCNMCGAQIADGATVCPACASRAASAPAAGPAATAGLNDNAAGMLAYVTFIPAIIFLVLEPYNKSRFVRFHSFQCIFICVASLIAHIALGVLSAIPFFILLTFPLHALVSLATLILLIFMALKANQGQMYKLPVVGDMAEKQANAM
jgi:uncharacterized membrane protein